MSRILDFKSSIVVMQSTSFCSCRFSLCQIFSIIFRSGDCAGQVNVILLFFNQYSMTERALWTGAWSSWKIQLFSGKCQAITGHKLSSSMSIYLLAVRLETARFQCWLNLAVTSANSVDRSHFMARSNDRRSSLSDNRFGRPLFGMFSKLFVVSNRQMIR